MKWFRRKKKPNEETGFLFRYDGIAIDTDQVIFFPKLEDVFHEVSLLHRQVFYPLCSIKMSLLNPDWNFYGHFIYVYREVEENIRLVRFHTAYCDDYSLGFDVIDNKYTLQSKMNLLELSDSYQKYQEKAAAKYQYFVQDYQKNQLENLLPKAQPINFLIKCFGKIPMWIQEDATPKDADGNALLFVGQVRVLDFIGEDQYLYLFYNAKEHYFVQREQYV
ncbi:hypothetical protein [Aureispira sp. CCB-E]|uniref:hypothetical protein n=1 Tax=Aureispira sp. CCB-E TaxID=3051121 RepID=UPI0028692D17|nr:hypothetical protein [Aureispira sp. CCB-E]WMX15502.1 hypothetical protein QP953_03815 [Aureispira sp. CCB-E]